MNNSRIICPCRTLHKLVREWEIKIQRAHDNPARLLEVLEELFNVGHELISKCDVLMYACVCVCHLCQLFLREPEEMNLF